MGMCMINHNRPVSATALNISELTFHLNKYLYKRKWFKHRW